MNCEEFNEQLADFLGGELSTEQRDGVRGHMESCRRCRDAARGLQAAAAAVETSVITEDEAKRRADAVSLPVTGDKRLVGARRSPRVLALLRYAAVIAIAFGGGYLYRGMPGGTPPPEDPGRGLNPVPPLAERIEGRARVVNNQFPGVSGLSKMLLVMAKP